MKDKILLGMLLLAYLVLATVYNVANPIFEAPDELAHYHYARYLAVNHALPVDHHEPGVMGQEEASQPPLYYAVAALVIAPAPKGDLAALARVNPSGSMGDPTTVGNKNRFLHPPDQVFPWRGEVLTVHLARFTSTLWGLLTIVFTYLLGRAIFASPALALASASVVAFTPQFLLMSAAVSNDVAVAAASAFFLWLAVRITRRRPTPWRSLGLGAAAGLAILAKPMAVGAIGLAILALVVAGRRDGQTPRTILARIATMLGGAFAACGWWFANNVVTYHALVPLGNFLSRKQLFDQVPSLSAALVDLVGLKESYWALFGWFSILAPRSYYTFFDLLMILAALGLFCFVLCVGRRDHRGESRPKGSENVRGRSPILSACFHHDGLFDQHKELDRVGVLFVAGWGVLIFLALCVYRLVVLAFQGRLLFPAISAYAILLVLGWSSLAPRRLGTLVAVILALALIVPAARAPETMLGVAYASPPILAPSAVHPTVPLNLRFGDEIDLLGADVDPPVGTRLSPGQDVAVTLYWQARRAIPSDYMVSLQLNDLGEQKLAIVDSMPGLGMAPTSTWVPGKVVVDRYDLRVSPTASGPAVASISVALYQRENLQTLPVYDASGTKLPALPSLGPYVIPGPMDKARAASGVSFAGRISLVQSTLDGHTFHSGDTISGQLLFGDLAPMSTNYTLFVHLEGDRGLIVGDDGQPLRGRFPTSFWRPGDLIAQDFHLAIPPVTSPGAYHVRIGWYDLATGQRLPTPRGDAIDLGTVEVK